MRKPIGLLAAVLLFVSTACNFPATARLFPTETPAPTATALIPSATPTQTATPAPTPTLTPIPAARIDQGDQLLFIGDYEKARREFQDALNSSADPEIQSAAGIGMARSLYLDGNNPLAIRTLENTLQEYPGSPHAASGFFFLAESYEAAQMYEAAARAYAKYLELRPGVLDSYMERRRGDAYSNAGKHAEAASAYQAAIRAAEAEGTASGARWLEIQLGKAYAAQGDYSSAIKTYLQVYENSNNDFARAQANLLLGQSYLALGMPEQANARFLDNIASFPRAFDSHTGLVQLVNSGVQVNEFSRGLVNYYARQYGLAVEAFNRYINSMGQTDARPYYYRALSRMAMNETGRAIDDLDYIILNYRSDALWASAWEEKAYLQWAYLNQYEAAAQTLLQYVEAAPQSEQAPELLFQAARIQERSNQLRAAASNWQRMMDAYPNAARSYRALFLSGVTYYRLADYPQALTIFQRALVLAGSPDDQAAAYLWIGKAHQGQGDTQSARAAWEQGANLDPTGYYSERCNDLLQNRTPFAITRPVDLGYDLSQERGLAEDWLRATFGLAPETQLGGLGELGSDGRLRRGAALWELGQYNDARTEFENLRKSITSDPVKTYQLMNYTHELGLYRTAVLSSRQILDLANLDDLGTLQAPAYFNHIRFGIYFKDQVLQASQKENLHPLLILSVMRQESMFEGFAISSAGARGLMQIMPATGQEIVTGMNWPPNYTVDDLYRPDVSIALGARYLARQRDYFGGNPFAILAAYNGGPGNTNFWIKLAEDDLDLLLEVIRAEETRKYITQIYEFFNIYRILYER